MRRLTRRGYAAVYLAAVAAGFLAGWLLPAYVWVPK